MGCLFASLMYFIFMSYKWVSLSIFPWTQSNLNWQKMRRLHFNDLLWQVMVKIFLILMKWARLEQISSSVSICKKLRPILDAVLKQGVLRLFQLLGSAWHASVLDEESTAMLKQLYWWYLIKDNFKVKENINNNLSN